MGKYIPKKLATLPQQYARNDILQKGVTRKRIHGGGDAFCTFATGIRYEMRAAGVCHHHQSDALLSLAGRNTTGQDAHFSLRRFSSGGLNL